MSQYSNNKLETVLYTYMQQRKKMEEKEKELKDTHREKAP